MSSSSKGRRYGFNFVDPWRVTFWQRLGTQSTQFCLQGEGALVLLLFLPLTIKPLYGMFVEMGLYCELWCLKVWHRLFLQDLQISALYHDFLHAQRFYANLLEPLLALLCFLCFQIWGLEIHWGNIFNVDQQTQIITVRKLVIFFFNILLHFHDQITRSEMSLKDICRM